MITFVAHDMGTRLRLSIIIFSVGETHCRTVGSHPQLEQLKTPEKLKFFIVRELGFEPRLTESESVVLPLDDSRVIEAYKFCQNFMAE